MRVRELWRYPIKSVGGEQLTEAVITDSGIEHDRGWGLVDDPTGNVLTARREPKLLFGSARVVDGQPIVTTDDGREVVTSTDFSEWLDRPVTLAAAAGAEGGTYEVPLDFENDDQWFSWQGPGDAWHDSPYTRVSIVSTGTLGDRDFRRFRTNILVEGNGEEDLIGDEVDLGEVRLGVMGAVDRCVIVTRPQPDLPRDLDVLRAINADRDGKLAVGAVVMSGGVVHIGDELGP